jgi:hypothetical protein
MVCAGNTEGDRPLRREARPHERRQVDGMAVASANDPTPESIILPTAALPARRDEKGMGTPTLGRVLEDGKPRSGAGLPSFVLALGRAVYWIGTVIVSETFESSKSVMVASLVNSTSVTVAVHFGFGHEPAGADGAFDSTVKRAWPFLGVAKGPLVPVTPVLKL